MEYKNIIKKYEESHNLKSEDYKILLDFDDASFKKAIQTFKKCKLENLSSELFQRSLLELKPLEKSFLFAIILQKNYLTEPSLLKILFGVDFEHYKTELPDHLKIELENLSNNIKSQSRQKKPLFKKEYVLRALLHELFTGTVDKQ